MNFCLRNCGLLVAWGDREKEEVALVNIYRDRMVLEVVAWRPLVGDSFAVMDLMFLPFEYHMPTVS